MAAEKNHKTYFMPGQGAGVQLKQPDNMLIHYNLDLFSSEIYSAGYRNFIFIPIFVSSESPNTKTKSYGKYSNKNHRGKQGQCPR